MNRACKNTANHDPHKRHRTIESTQDRAENRAYTGNVKQLDKRVARGIHRHIVDIVAHTERRCLTLTVSDKHALDKLAVGKVTHD